MSGKKRVIFLVSLCWTGGKSVTFERDPGWSRCYVNPSRKSLYRLARVVRYHALEIYPSPDGWSAKIKSS